MKKTILGSLVLFLSALFLHYFLLGLMQQWNVAAAVLSPGAHIPLWKLAAGAFFLLLRFLIFIFSPAYFLALTSVAVYRSLAKQY